LIPKAEIFFDSQLKVGMTARPDSLMFPKMDKIRGQLNVANQTTPKILIQSIQLESVELMNHAEDKYEVMINPGQSHTLTFECSCPELHSKLHLIRIEYAREEDSIQYVDKVNLYLPLLPFIKYNPNTLVVERLETLWTKITVGWQDIASPLLQVDRDFFSNSHDIEHAFPSIRITTPQFENSETDSVQSNDSERQRIRQSPRLLPGL
jgi:hypothetical protein